ncbi:MAG TPA: HPF/RaiA family ribosome-associated protein [Candidatus Acidoferrales bacterium]|nr:HPF/RaiA family ribosome-associated protein [Candidatus Acidoferrales bacterium]
MEIPLQVTFRNVKPSEALEGWIREEAAKLETFYDRIMGCRVAVEMLHSHHRKGSRYHVRIDLTIPGGELVIKREPNVTDRLESSGRTKASKRLEVDAPQKDLRLAISKAFKAAARQLQEYGRRQRGDVKTHETLPAARVSQVFPDQGYGFLQTEDGREIYFHKDSVLKEGFSRLRAGTEVAFVEEQGEKGAQASTVRIAAQRKHRRAAARSAVSGAG